MSFVRIWLHCVWATKNRTPYLKDGVRIEVLTHIIENSKAKNIHIDCINGHYQHLHALISLGSTQNISDVMHKIKGESSYWINKNLLTEPKFGWQDDFYCVSIGVPQLGTIRKYIHNQEGHHAIVNWEEEFDVLIKEGEMQIMRG
jgi:REP element-mobilizing transposase RayT